MMSDLGHCLCSVSGIFGVHSVVLGELKANVAGRVILLGVVPRDEPLLSSLVRTLPCGYPTCADNLTEEMSPMTKLAPNASLHVPVGF